LPVKERGERVVSWLEKSDRYDRASVTLDLPLNFDEFGSTKSPSDADFLGEPSFRYRLAQQLTAMKN
jgi:hypothetical protein